ncbi:MAG TPA: hypothetical protein PLH37_02690 [bacterium]|nr:hypothetical protein [bacterium]
MVFPETSNQNQNFKPAPQGRQALSLRLKQWFSFLTPKKKIFLVLGLVLALLATGLIIYFVFGQAVPTCTDDFCIYLQPDGGYWAPGSTQQVRVMLERTLPNQGGSDTGVDVSFNVVYPNYSAYNVIFDRCIIDGTDYITGGDPCVFGATVPSATGQAQMQIALSRPGGVLTSGVPLSGPGVYELATLVFNVPTGTPTDPTFYLDFQLSTTHLYTGINDCDNDGSGPHPACLRTDNGLYDLLLTTGGARNVYLRLREDTVSLGNDIQLEVWASSTVQDIVAVGTQINYDPQYLNVKVNDSLEFPAAGSETHNRSTGQLTLVRGTYGNGIVDDGNDTPQSSTFGLRGGAIIAYLTVTGVNLTSPTTAITVAGSQFVLDDGQGTIISASGAGGTYTVQETPPLDKTHLITEKNINCKLNASGSYDLTVSWLTNFAGDSNLVVNSGSAITKATYELNHLLTASGVADSGVYTITSRSQATPPESASATNVPYDCKALTAKLEIKDLVVTPESSSAVVSFITTGGVDQGKAIGRVIHLINTVTNVDTLAGGTVPESSSRNLHQFNLSSLTPNTKYQITVRAEDADTGVAEASTSFVTLPQTADKNTNVVLKVERDRVCDAWLYCRSAVTVKNAMNENQNLCFDVGLCNRLNPKTKECEVTANLGQLGITSANQTFDSPNLVYANTPGEVEIKTQAAVVYEKKFKNLSGYSKVGMDWGKTCSKTNSACNTDADCTIPPGQSCNFRVVEGYKHYALMNTVGENFNVPNGNFELSDVWPWKNNSLGEIDLMKDILHAGNNFLQVAVEKEQLAALTGTTEAYAGAMVPLGEIKATNDVVIAFNTRTDGEAKNIRVAARTAAVNSGSVSFDDLYNTTFTISGTEKQIVKKIDVQLPAGYTELIFNQLRSDNTSNDFSKSFYIDNVSAQSVLHVQNAAGVNPEENYVARMCRLYPSSSAPACQYTDWSGGKLYNGWQGFCVEPDPGKPSQCLNWWPVDIIPGESDVFGNDPQVGYKDRKPLYYCLEAAGNYPFVRLTRGGRSDLNINTGAMFYRGIANCETNNGSNCGWPGASEKITTIVKDELNLRLIDIERIVLEPVCEEGDDDKHCFSKKANSNAYIVLDRATNWEGFVCVGSNCHDAKYYFSNEQHFWDDGTSMLNNTALCHNQAVDLFAVHAVFENGNFTGLQAGLCNWNANGDYGFVRYNVYFYLREPCDVLAEVIDPYGSGYPWSNKILANSWNDASNVLNYSYNQDYAPYGAAVPPAKDTNFPDRWTNPLFVQPPAVSSSYMAPYQVRAGSPFAINQKLQKYCTNSGKLGQPCNNSNDCYAAGVIAPINVCLETEKSGINYEPTCIAGDDNSLGKACTEDSDCGFGLSGQTGTCMGIELSDGQKQKIVGDYTQGIQKLSNLFVRGLNVWYWYADDNKYSQVCSYNSGVDCGSPSDQNYASCVTLRDACWDERATKGTAPSIDHLTVNSQSSGQVVGTGNVGVTIKFNSNVDLNQLPLTGLSVDWGDGKINDIVNLRIAPHVYNSNPTLNDPHIMTHTYTCQEGGTGWVPPTTGGQGGYCLFQPRVQIKDNWGWCNAGVRGTNSSICPASWQNSGVDVKVFPR